MKKDKNGRLELCKQIDVGIPISAWQTQQIDQVLNEFPDLLAYTPGVDKGVVHRIHTAPDVVIRALVNLCP